MIRKYSLNWFALGLPDKNKQHNLYLRYLYTLDGKKYLKNIPTNYKLTKDQITLLKNGQLKGDLNKNLQEIKIELINIIEVLNIKNSSYPTIEQLIEFYKHTSNTLQIEIYEREFFKENNFKRSTARIYKCHIKRFIKYYNSELKKRNLNVNTICTNQFLKEYVEDLQMHYKGQVLIGKRKTELSNNSIINISETIKRFLNFIAEENNLKQLDYKINLAKTSNKLHLTTSQINTLLEYDVNNTKAKHPKTILNLYYVQRLIQLNINIGLRINELLQIRGDKIQNKGKYYVISFIDEKQNDERTIIVRDLKGIEVIKEFTKQNIINPEYPFKLFSSHDYFNKYLRLLALKSNVTETITLHKVQGKESKYITKPINKLISSHSIRRYAIQKNLVKYGMVLAKQFSGHKSTKMIEDHYSRNLNENEILELLSK